MQNNNNIQLPPNLKKKSFLVFLVAFASIRFIWFKLLWRYLLFIDNLLFTNIGSTTKKKEK